MARLFSAVDTANKAKAPFSSSEAGGDSSSLVLSNSYEDDGVRQLQSLRPLPLLDLGFRLYFHLNNIKFPKNLNKVYEKINFIF
jgi:hypothetical protein